jgi:hypothetical protein
MNCKLLLVGLTLAVGTLSSVAPSNAASQKPFKVAETQTELYMRVQKEMADEARANRDRTNVDKMPAQTDVDTYKRAQDVTGTTGLARAPHPQVDSRAQPDGAPTR